jgi:hypothetical protein
MGKIVVTRWKQSAGCEPIAYFAGSIDCAPELWGNQMIKKERRSMTRNNEEKLHPVSHLQIKPY